MGQVIKFGAVTVTLVLAALGAGGIAVFTLLLAGRMDVEQIAQVVSLTRENLAWTTTGTTSVLATPVLLRFGLPLLRKLALHGLDRVLTAIAERAAEIATRPGAR